jgi:hypothetical protein
MSEEVDMLNLDDLTCKLLGAGSLVLAGTHLGQPLECQIFLGLIYQTGDMYIYQMITTLFF